MFSLYFVRCFLYPPFSPSPEHNTVYLFVYNKKRVANILRLWYLFRKGKSQVETGARKNKIKENGTSSNDKLVGRVEAKM